MDENETMDVVLAVKNDGEVFYYPNPPGDVFTYEKLLIKVANSEWPDITLCDWNGDGHYDIISIPNEDYSSHIQYYENMGSTASGETPKFKNPEYIKFANGDKIEVKRNGSIASCDLDNDGDLDIVYAKAMDCGNNGGPHGVFFLENKKGSGSLVLEQPHKLYSNAGVFNQTKFSIATTDLNGDGVIDIAMTKVLPNKTGDSATIVYIGYGKMDGTNLNKKISGYNYKPYGIMSITGNEITCNVSRSSDVEFTMFDLHGKQLFAKNVIVKNKGRHKIGFDLKKISKNICIVSVKTVDGVFVRRVLINGY